MTAYYNEFDPYAAQWLRNLIAAGHIAPGFVDERSIEDVKPWELFGYTQCRFFAGVGVWSLALRRAGWPDDRPVWTASCPCQPFSSAGPGKGFADERHLWPAFYHLVGQLEPAILLGEQVASKDADPWVDLVHADMEAMGYAFGCVAFPSASVGAPHIRDRNYWVANSLRSGQPGQGIMGQSGDSKAGENWQVGGAFHDGGSLWVADTELQQRPHREPGVGDENDAGRRVEGAATTTGLCDDMRPGPVNGLWRSADWLHCRDGKWRPVEPSTFPLVNGAAARVGRLRTGVKKLTRNPRVGKLRAYGNALNAEAARVFIESVMESIC